MIRRIQPWFWLALLALPSCDRAADHAARGDDAGGKPPPRITRAKRGGTAEAPDPRPGIRAAFAEARRISNEMERHKALAAVVWEAHEVEPALADEAFSLLETDSPEKILLQQHFAMRLADQDPQQALAWADALESEREKEAARARIALVVADTDPRRAAEILAESTMENRELDVAIVQVLQHWTAQNPTEAAAWLVVFPPGGFREAGMKTVLGQWARQSPAAAMGWLDSLTDAVVHAEASRALHELYQEQIPETRAEWLENAPPAVRALLEWSGPVGNE